jgi:hypothetical protein
MGAVGPYRLFDSPELQVRESRLRLPSMPGGGALLVLLLNREGRLPAVRRRG